MNLDNEPFYFETDTLALRNNQDYSCLLKTLILLEGQRIKACNDLEKLIDLKEEALKNPTEFVNKLKNNEKIDCPDRQKVYVLPDIDWNKYYDSVDLEDLEQIKNQKINRVQSLRQSNKLVQQLNENETKTRKQNQNPEQTKNYNKSWSVEEQRHLEELLIEFPPEDNEAARWRKIANKLGTRTPLQVQSHCQKYFIKLAKAGLPIPGRMPNLKTYVTKKGTRGKGKSSYSIGGGRARLTGLNQAEKRIVGRGCSLNEISSMWSSFNPPITMNDEHEFDEFNYENSNQEQEDGDEEEEEEEEDDEENESLFEKDQEDDNLFNNSNSN